MTLEGALIVTLVFAPIIVFGAWRVRVGLRIAQAKTAKDVARGWVNHMTPGWSSGAVAGICLFLLLLDWVNYFTRLF